MKKVSKNILPLFLPIALAVTLICGIIYITIQQNYRISANDPQIQIAEDVAKQLALGQPTQYFIPNSKVDISKSLGSFILIFDKNGKPIGGSAVINGKQPVMPSGVFKTTKQRGETRFTWAPQQNTRIALVMVYYKDKGEGFVALGRSLREVEYRNGALGAIVFLGWTVSLVILFIFIVLTKKLLKHNLT